METEKKDVNVTEHSTAVQEIGATTKNLSTITDDLIICDQERPILLKDEMKQLMDRLAMQLPNMTKWAYGGRTRAKVGLFVSRAKALAFLTLLAGVSVPSAVAIATSLVAAEPSRTEYRAFTDDVADLLEELTGVIA